MTRDELLAALTVERYDQRWWTGVHPNPPRDDDLTCARRRRDALADLTAHEKRGVA